jgi:hypothetical protein
MDYSQLAAQEAIEKTVEALKGKDYEVHVVESGAEALSKIKELIPQGASVMNGSSVTLETIGFVDHLKEGKHGWNNLHAGIVAEKDGAKQAQLRREALLSEYYLGSVHALMEDGEFIVASNTASQLSHVVFSSPNLIFVVGAQKIVPDVAEGMKRLREYVIPLEDQHMQQKYNVHTALNKEVIFHGESPLNKRKIRFILVNEKLGF